MKPASICGAVAALEPTNQTRSTMRARTWPAVPLPVGITTPTPTIVSVSPDQVLEGSGDTQITVTGTGFSNSSVVYWNGAALGLTGVTGSMNGTMLTATVPAADFAATGTGSVTVSTPTANPSLSNAMKVTVYAYPVPKVTSISPALTPLNTPVTVTVTVAVDVSPSASVIVYVNVSVPT